MARKPADDAVGRDQWKRIAATVKPMRGKVSAILLPPARVRKEPVASAAIIVAPTPPPLAPPTGAKRARRPAVPVLQHAAPAVTATLDGSWDRSIRTGRIQPDTTIDLHGHNLAGAHSHLARALDQAVAQGARVILLIAGKSRSPDEAPRGAIRREVESWLAHSRHAGRIAAVRNAHPRHGGAGALYLVLRKT